MSAPRLNVKASLSSTLARFPSRKGRKRTKPYPPYALRLDPSVLRLIFTHLSLLWSSDQSARHNDLSNLCRVCRHWSLPAREVLYQQVWARSLKGARALLKFLSRHPEYCTRVTRLDIPPLWIASAEGVGTLVTFSADPAEEEYLSANQFKEYIEKMALCTYQCRHIDQVHLSADQHWLDFPRRAPRVDKILDLVDAHKFLRRLTLDDGGLHRTSISDVLPDTIKLDHLEELTFVNFAFVSPVKTLLIPVSVPEKLVKLPRLRTLRLIHCTSGDGALLPLTAQISQTLRSLTIIQRSQKFSVAQDGSGDRWHASFARSDVFQSLSQRISHLTLNMDSYLPSYFLSLSKDLRSLHLTARYFHRAALTDLPMTLRHLSVTVTDDDFFLSVTASIPNATTTISSLNSPTSTRSSPTTALTPASTWTFFDDLSSMMSEASLLQRIPSFRILDISLPKWTLQNSVGCWIRLYTLQKQCRHGRILLRIRPNDPGAYHEMLSVNGRNLGDVNRPPVAGTIITTSALANPSGTMAGHAGPAGEARPRNRLKRLMSFSLVRHK